MDQWREWQSNLAHMNGVSWPEIPLEATVRGYRLSGLVGPVFLLAPLALAGLRWRAGRQLLLMFVACGLPYFSNIGARFLLPCLPFLSLLLGWVCTSVPGVGLAVVAAHAVLSWPGVVERYAHRYAWQLGAVDWRAALRLTPESEYLSKRLGITGWGWNSTGAWHPERVCFRHPLVYRRITTGRLSMGTPRRWGAGRSTCWRPLCLRTECQPGAAA